MEGRTNRTWGRARVFGLGASASMLVATIALGCSSSEALGGDDQSGDRNTTIPNGGGDGGSRDGSYSNDPNDPNDPNNPGGSDAGPPVIKCNTIAAGQSSVNINGKDRAFKVQLPSSVSSKVALLFLWHGWMQDPNKFANEIVYDVPQKKWVPFDPNGFPMPLMIVTPYDTKMIPPWGLDWDIVSGGNDLVYFDAMMQCINEQFSVDKEHIYSFGFSAGAVFTNLLSAKYPHLFAATIAESGAWFSDPAQQKEVLVPIMPWKWPAFDPADKGNVLLTHGGKDDFATIISLENTNKEALPFLKAAGRTVVECDHQFGHTLEPDLTQGMLYDYMWAHTASGGPLTNLPASFPTDQKPLFNTRCRLHTP